MVLRKSEKLGIDNDKLSIEGFSEKLKEESLELINAIDLYKSSEGSKEHVVEEVFDNIQVCIDILEKMYHEGIDIPEEVNRHNKKLIERGWQPKAVIKFEVHKGKV